MHTPLSRFGILSTVFRALLLCLIVMGGTGFAVGHAAEKKIAFIGGLPSHGPGEHEYSAGLLLLQKCLAGTPGIKIEMFLNGWPANPAALRDADAILIFCEGGPSSPILQADHLQVLENAMARGVGLGLVHYAVEPTVAKGEAEFLRWVGGCFELNWSVNPTWEANFDVLPPHPILRGVKPFRLRDEWYFHMRFAEGMKGVTPILSAVPAAVDTLGRPNGPHEGNPAVRAAVMRGEPQVLAWAFERPDGGRGFGFTGGHYHKNWANNDVRKAMLNAVLWLAKIDVPSGGVSSSVSAADLAANLDPKPTPIPSNKPTTFLLWPEGAPGALGDRPEDSPTLTLHRPDPAQRDGSSLLILPGGGYASLADHEGTDYARWFAAHGVTCYVLKYRLGSSGYRHPAMLQDASRALRFVRSLARSERLDPARVGVIGSSAGGHLASTLITHFAEGKSDSLDPIERESSRPDLAILCYPVITLGKFTHVGSSESLLGKKPSADLTANLSNELQVTSATPPCFLWHTAEDKVVPVENSLLFAEALRRAGVPFSLHVYETGAHGLGLGRPDKPAPPWAEQCLYWLHERAFLRSR